MQTGCCRPGGSPALAITTFYTNMGGQPTESLVHQVLSHSQSQGLPCKITQL